MAVSVALRRVQAGEKLGSRVATHEPFAHFRQLLRVRDACQHRRQALRDVHSEPRCRLAPQQLTLVRETLFAPLLLVGGAGGNVRSGGPWVRMPRNESARCGIRVAGSVAARPVDDVLEGFAGDVAAEVRDEKVGAPVAADVGGGRDVGG